MMLPESLYMQLLEAVSPVGADLTSDVQDFLADELSKYSGPEYEFANFVRKNARIWFRSCSTLPQWIQNAEWQFDEGKPMCFVGQISIPPSVGMFHDEACIFVFGNAKGVVKTVLQLA